MELTEVKALLPEIAPESEYGVLVVFMKAVIEWMESHERHDTARFDLLPTKQMIDNLATKKDVKKVEDSVKGVVTVFKGGEMAVKIGEGLGKFTFRSAVTLAALGVALLTIYTIVTGRGLELVQSAYHIILSPKK